MTKITIYRNENREVERFTCSGHAGYSEYGTDIVCASISVLVINTINSIEAFTSVAYTCEADEETGDIELIVLMTSTEMLAHTISVPYSL